MIKLLQAEQVQRSGNQGYCYNSIVYHILNLRYAASDSLSLSFARSPPRSLPLSSTNTLYLTCVQVRDAIDYVVINRLKELKFQNNISYVKDLSTQLGAVTR